MSVTKKFNSRLLLPSASNYSAQDVEKFERNGIFSKVISKERENRENLGHRLGYFCREVFKLFHAARSSKTASLLCNSCKEPVSMLREMAPGDLLLRFLVLKRTST